MKTTESIISIANTFNAKAANLKDSQIYKSRFGRELREIAHEAIENPIIGTAAEIGEKYGMYCPGNYTKVADHSPEDVFVWAVAANKPFYVKTRRHDLSLTVIDQIVK